MKKMGKKLIVGTAMVASALSLSACGFGPEPAVYGPPPDFSETMTQEEPATEENSSEEREPLTQSETGTYFPEPAVYGPPEQGN